MARISISHEAIILGKDKKLQERWEHVTEQVFGNSNELLAPIERLPWDVMSGITSLLKHRDFKTFLFVSPKLYYIAQPLVWKDARVSSLRALNNFRARLHNVPPIGIPPAHLWDAIAQSRKSLVESLRIELDAAEHGSGISEEIAFEVMRITAFCPKICINLVLRGYECFSIGLNESKYVQFPRVISVEIQCTGVTHDQNHQQVQNCNGVTTIKNFFSMDHWAFISLNSNLPIGPEILCSPKDEERKPKVGLLAGIARRCYFPDCVKLSVKHLTKVQGGRYPRRRFSRTDFTFSVDFPDKLGISGSRKLLYSISMDNESATEGPGRVGKKATNDNDPLRYNDENLRFDMSKLSVEQTQFSLEGLLNSSQIGLTSKLRRLYLHSCEISTNLLAEAFRQILPGLTHLTMIDPGSFRGHKLSPPRRAPNLVESYLHLCPLIRLLGQNLVELNLQDYDICSSLFARRAEEAVSDEVSGYLMSSPCKVLETSVPKKRTMKAVATIRLCAEQDWMDLRAAAKRISTTDTHWTIGHLTNETAIEIADGLITDIAINSVCEADSWVWVRLAERNRYGWLRREEASEEDLSE